MIWWSRRELLVFFSCRPWQWQLGGALLRTQKFPGTNNPFPVKVPQLDVILKPLSWWDLEEPLPVRVDITDLGELIVWFSKKHFQVFLPVRGIWTWVYPVAMFHLPEMTPKLSLLHWLPIHPYRTLLKPVGGNTWVWPQLNIIILSHLHWAWWMSGHRPEWPTSINWQMLKKLVPQKIYPIQCHKPCPCSVLPPSGKAKPILWAKHTFSLPGLWLRQDSQQSWIIRCQQTNVSLNCKSLPWNGLISILSVRTNGEGAKCTHHQQILYFRRPRFKSSLLKPNSTWS